MRQLLLEYAIKISHWLRLATLCFLTFHELLLVCIYTELSLHHDF